MEIVERRKDNAPFQERRDMRCFSSGNGGCLKYVSFSPSDTSAGSGRPQMPHPIPLVKAWATAFFHFSSHREHPCLN